MPRSIADIEADLVRVRAAINAMLDGGVASFEHEGGDAAKMIPLKELNLREQSLIKQLASARRAANRFVAARLVD